MLRNPFASEPSGWPSLRTSTLTQFTDPYFRGFDNSLPDYWRYTEWARDFDSRYSPMAITPDSGLEDPPSLMLVRLMHDHTGNYSAAIDGVNTPESGSGRQRLRRGPAGSEDRQQPHVNDTLIFVIEDDAQDGGDHVDSHRSVAFVAGPYVKQGAVVSTPYNTVGPPRTIEEVLGIPQLNGARCRT